MAHRSNIIKVGCTHDKQQFPLLFTMDQSKPLPQVVEEVCRHWQIANPELHSLKLDDASGVFITEKNRMDLKDGVILKLCLSPAASAANFVKSLSSPLQQAQVLKDLKVETKDAVFAHSFVGAGGAQVIQKVIAEFQHKDEPTNLSYALSVYNELINHGLINADEIPDSDIRNIMALSVPRNSGHYSVMRIAMRILATYVSKSRDGYRVAMGGLNLPGILGFMRDPIPQGGSDREEIEPATIESILYLINRLLLASPTTPNEVTVALESKDIFPVLEKVLRGPIDPTFSRELYVFEQLWLNRYSVRRDLSYSDADALSARNLRTLTMWIKEIDSGEGKGTNINTRLGFTNPNSPQQDFIAPPGVLTLDNMAYFSEQREKTNIVIEQLSRPEEYACPFTRTSIEITRLLLKIFNVGFNPADDPSIKAYTPLMLTSARALEELFVASMHLANRMWREMEAKVTDFDKVMQVVERQLMAALKNPKAHPIKSMDELRNKLQEFSYENVKREEMEQLVAEEQAQMEADAVKDLRAKLRADMLELVKTQRKSSMTDGVWFNTIGRGKVNKEVFFAVLSPNFKTLHWNDPGDHNTNEKLTMHSLQHSCSVSDIKEFYVGKNVPSIQKAKKTDGDLERRVFGLMGVIEDRVDECLEFTAPDRKTCSIWVDGLRALMGKQCEEPETLEDVDMLVKMELRLRLLHLTGVPLAAQAPVKPPYPTDFDFCYVDIEGTSSA